MKKTFPLTLFLLLFLLTLSGCVATQTENSSAVRVIIEDCAWAETENNGQLVKRGEDVTFRIKASDGFSLAGTDYDGEVQIWQEDSEVLLTLLNVRYPTRVQLNLTREYFVLRYEPNGGEGEAFTDIQEIKYHKRPNTANADVPFTKPGCTLLGWNTSEDGTGISVGLGSRVTVGNEGITLYAQWAEWTDESCFTWVEEDGCAIITGCSAAGNTLVIPARLGGLSVTGLAENAFAGNTAETVVFPDTLRVAEENCFRNALIRELYLFDNIEVISDSCFPASGLQTLHINAAEAPYGTSIYKESCYADKVDLLILSQDQNRIVFYGGCSMWYNLDMGKVLRTVGEDWYPVNIALNGTVSSEIQLQILLPYLHDGDVFFHTPEFTSDQQMMRSAELSHADYRLWAGIEYNYDLLSSVDLTAVTGELDSLCAYLDTKKEETEYTGKYLDSHRRSYIGENGEIPFSRYEPEGKTLGDTVSLNTGLFTAESTARLGEWYARLQDRGIRVFVSFACVNMDALTAEEQKNVKDVDAAFRSTIETMPGVVLLSDLTRFCYRNANFFDTNYHLLSDAAASCTTQWLKAFSAYLSA